MPPGRKQVGPRISPGTRKWLEAHFENLTCGSEYCLDMIPALYGRAIHECKQRFTPAELSLMLDVLNATMLTPGMAGQQLAMCCVDGMELDGLDSKWEVNRPEFTARLTTLTQWEAACLEIWARAFWESGAYEQGIKPYIKGGEK